MSSVSEVHPDLQELLTSINLEQYLGRFQEAGYRSLKDCAHLSDSVLQKIGVLPTGHRRRILKQLEMILSKLPKPAIYANVRKTKKEAPTLPAGPAWCAGADSWPELARGGSAGPEAPDACLTLAGGRPISKENGAAPESALAEQDDPPPADAASPHNLEACQNVALGSGDSRDAALVTEKNADGQGQSEARGSVGWAAPLSKPEETGALGPPEPSVCTPEATKEPGTLSMPPPPSPFFEFKGEMIVNDLYVSSAQNPTPIRSRSKLVSRPSRSFMLRHRPVPEIPATSKGAASGR